MSCGRADSFEQTILWRLNSLRFFPPSTQLKWFFPISRYSKPNEIDGVYNTADLMFFSLFHRVNLARSCSYFMSQSYFKSIRKEKRTLMNYIRSRRSKQTSEKEMGNNVCKRRLHICIRFPYEKFVEDGTRDSVMPGRNRNVGLFTEQ